jgi:hypothetical protein
MPIRVGPHRPTKQNQIVDEGGFAEDDLPRRDALLAWFRRRPGFEVARTDGTERQGAGSCNRASKRAVRKARPCCCHWSTGSVRCRVGSASVLPPPTLGVGGVGPPRARRRKPRLRPGVAPTGRDRKTLAHLGCHAPRCARKGPYPGLWVDPSRTGFVTFQGRFLSLFDLFLGTSRGGNRNYFGQTEALRPCQ